MRPPRPNIADGPLFAWGDALRAARIRRRRRRLGIVIAGIGISVVLLSAALPPTPRLVWNATASAPIGLYAVTPGAWAEPGQMVVAWPPASIRRMAAARRYLPLNVPLVKRVAAFAGDEVCALGDRIFINGSPAAVLRTVDARGRAMPRWTGCVRLHGRELFVLTDNPNSFDGRYFGVTAAGDVIGKARLLWAR